MKRELSIKEFQSYISEHTPSAISFWSINQKWYTAKDSLKIYMVFPIIMVGESPNIICLKDETGKALSFDRVKNVYVNEDETVLGAVFDIRCADKTYTLIAS